MNSRFTARVALAGTAAVTALALLAACSGASGSGGASPNQNRPTNEIHVQVLGDAAAAAEQQLATEFNKTSSVKVVIDKGADGGADYANQVRASIGTKDAPDIFMSWGAAGIQPYIKSGALLDLSDFIKQNPKLKSSFLPSVFDQEVVNGKTYGIPMRGVGPVVLYYNKNVLDKAGLKPATSWDDLFTQTTALKSAGVTPIAVGAADKWPTLMWFEYVYSRVIGNAAVAKGLAGDDSVWSSKGSKEALSDIRKLVDAGAFGTTYDSVHYGNDGSPKLLSSGKAAYELMGNWNYATLAGGDPSFVQSGLGYTTFPAISGGAGNPDELSGNLSNYYNVAADTRYPDTVAKFLALLYSDDFVKAELALGNLSPTTNAGDLVASDTSIPTAQKDFLDFQLKVIKQAPSFQLSWDQAIPVAHQADLTNAVAAYFDGSSSADDFITAIQGATKN